MQPEPLQSHRRSGLGEGCDVVHRLSSAPSVEEVVAQLDEHGYAVVERRADASVMTRLLADVEPWAQRADLLTLKFFGGGLRKVESPITKSKAVVTLMADPLLHAVNEAVLGPEALLNGSSVFLLENGGADQTLHTDGSIYEPMLARSPGGPHYLLVYMWAVTDFTRENGATRVVPGSHRWPAGRFPTDDDPVEYLEMPQGSFAVWLGSTFHAASHNTTAAVRVGTQMGFNCGWLRPHEAFLLLVPPLVARDLPLNVQEVLGYRAHRGMLGCVEQQSPIHKLGLVPQPWGDPGEATAGPSPEVVEDTTRRCFADLGVDPPAAVASELRQLEVANRACAAATDEGTREILDVAARAQARQLLDHLMAGNHAAVLQRLRSRA